MPRKPKIPWLDYEGQDTEQILACKDTHRIDSLLCTLEQAIQLRQQRHPELASSPEEETLLAIRALEREVNNGGYHQFFLNSSCEYALTVVPALENISCHTTAALTRRALGALNLRPLTLAAIEHGIRQPDAERDRFLDALDQEFYRLTEIEPKLFAFVEAHRQAFVIEKTYVEPKPPKRGNHNLIALGVGLEIAGKIELTFAAVRQLAAEIAVKKEIKPTEAELDGAAYEFLFKSFLKSGDLENCEKVSGPAFDLAREDTGHCVLQRQWVEQLIAKWNFARADEVTLQYLEYLSNDDTSIDFIKNRIKYWAAPLRKYSAELPRSCEFFRARFTGIKLGDPPARPN